jgi:hypothetical protein
MRHEQRPSNRSPTMAPRRWGMSKAVEFASRALLAGVASVAAARIRDLSPWQTALSFPLGIAVYLFSKAGVS